MRWLRNTSIAVLALMLVAATVAFFASRELPFHPVEPVQPSARRGLGLLLPIALAVVALLTLLFTWQWVQKRDSTRPIEVNARAARVASTIPAPQPVSAPSPAAATRVDSAGQPEPSSSSVTGAPTTLASNATSQATMELLADASESDVTNTAAMAPPPPPKPAPLRLQAIVFNPRRPSAMIGGKTLFVGDRVGDMRVMAIDKESATLTGAGQTNVLVLSE